jgi:hypothetical protein
MKRAILVDMNTVETDFKYWLFPDKPTKIWNLFSKIIIFIIFCVSKLSKGN